MNINLGIYDIGTGLSCIATKVVDVSSLQSRSKHATLAYFTTKSGPMVQLCSHDEPDPETGARIHWAYGNDFGREMILEDEGRFGFAAGELLKAILTHSPEGGAS